MEKKHIITITGSLGSGKSSTAKRVAELLGYTHASGGDFMRSIANDRGISLEELSQISESDPSVDNELDDQNIKIGKENNIVIDSRLGFYFIPQSFKVLIDLEPSIAAQRILKDAIVNPNRFKETKDKFDTEENIKKSIAARLESEKKRYKELYDIDDHRDHKYFDLIINSDNIPLEDVVQKIIDKYQQWLKNPS